MNLIALRDDAPALALRGIAMAQLGDFARAKTLLRSATRAFGPAEAVARARCVVAEAEIAFASRELSWAPQALEAARATLERRGDPANAAHARHLQIRRLLLIGELDVAENMLGALDSAHLSPSARAVHELIVAGVALRRVRTGPARAALARASRAADIARIPALRAEVDSAAALLDAPAARLVEKHRERVLRLADVEKLLGSRALIVDGCRHVVRENKTVVPLASRPVLFTLARLLATAWPGDVSRDEIVARAFRARRADDSHRARLRVEIGRLRKELRALAEIHATPAGFVLAPRRARTVCVLAPPVDAPHADVLALLADGEAWSSSALGLALAASQRTVQRSLDALAATGRVQSFGRGRARRWMTPPVPGFATMLLLPAPLPID